MQKDDIISLLKTLGFSALIGGEWNREFGDCVIGVDLDKERIHYDDKINLGDKTTGNFEHDENFVVLECVVRLLAKGYLPGDLFLEKRWQLGRTGKSGKADIVVQREGKTVLIIECKTWEEYKPEISRMERDGGQLFSYLQQDKNTDYLCLYTSAIVRGKLEYKNAIVKIVDREADIVAHDGGNESVLLYKNANTKEELHEVWKKTFNLYFHYNGIFERDVAAYQPELTPLKAGNLLRLSESEKVFNRFAEILRHNNISDNANAFNRILSLILCKIVDEGKDEKEVLDFQVRETEESDSGDTRHAENIQDRLQKLYKVGMDRYLGEEIVYYEDEEVRKIIALFPEQTPLEDIEKMFRDIKYYTNNEFSFKPVHNKQLFVQNARVLNEVIKMLQNFKFRYSHKESMKQKSLLGDFFELLLNHGVKQSEGQFFTPPPVVRFMLLSLGIDKIIRQKMDAGKPCFLPKTLDYACGSGHFLTETINEIQAHLCTIDAAAENRELRANIIEYKESVRWAGEYIFGIEKDYRLARTAQVACFLNGDGDANIIYGDGLENHEQLNARRQPFDLIVANPPYSVKAFRDYLNVGKKEFSLYEHLSEKSSEIETLFVERTAQMLRPGGLAAIILPASILSNNSVIYNRTRQLILEKFEICGVAEMGGKTFIATGTNTVILFLRRRDDNYAKDRMYVARDVFGEKLGTKKYPRYINERKLLSGYTKHRGVLTEDYNSLISRCANSSVEKSELWKNYLRDFEQLTDIKKLKKSAVFCDSSAAAQQRQLDKRFYDFVLPIEHKKFYVYLLCMRGLGYKYDVSVMYGSQRTVAVDSGSDTNGQKNFLGYEFSHAKGREGIKILQDGGLLYDNTGAENSGRINSYILKNIWDESIGDIDESLREHLKIVNLTGCINFENSEFNHAINFKPAASVKISSRWNMILLGDAELDIRKGTSITKSRTVAGKIPVIAGGMGVAYYHNEANRHGETITISASGNAGYVSYHRTPIFASDCTTIQSTNPKSINTSFVFYYLQWTQKQLYALARGAVQPHVYPKDIQNLSIPLPPIKIQKTIAAECEKIDAVAKSAHEKIARLRDEMEQQYDSKSPLMPLGEFVSSQYGYTETAKGTGNVRFLRITDIDESGVIKTKDKKYIDADNIIMDKYLLSEDDIVVARSGSVGRMAICKNGDEPMVFASYLVRLKTQGDKLLPEYLFHFSQTARYWKQVRDLSVTLSQPNINAEKIKSIKIPLPTMDKQTKIVAILRDKHKRITALQAQITTAAADKEKVLKKYL